MREETAEKSKSFFSISLASLRSDSILPFDLYLKHDGSGKHVLYRHRDTPFSSAILDSLQENKVDHLYVPREQRDEYFEYESQQVALVVNDETIPIEVKSRVVYNTATLIMEDLFRVPKSVVRIEQAKRTIQLTIRVLTQSTEATKQLLFLTSHDYYTYTHSVNVTIYGTALAERVLPPEEKGNIPQIGEGLLLHDLGKSMIPTSIINKPGKLSDEEWAMMRKHPEMGYQILQQTKQGGEFIDRITLQHHERPDGRGYPFGLPADEIHPYSKICTIADVFDAITTVRSYRDPLSTYDALRVMRDEMGEHFHWPYFNEFVKMFSI